MPPLEKTAVNLPDFTIDEHYRVKLFTELKGRIGEEIALDVLKRNDFKVSGGRDAYEDALHLTGKSIPSSDTLERWLEQWKGDSDLFNLLIKPITSHSWKGVKPEIWKALEPVKWIRFYEEANPYVSRLSRIYYQSSSLDEVLRKVLLPINPEPRPHLVRHGVPDFVAEREGKIFCVEVKTRRNPSLHESQVKLVELAWKYGFVPLLFKINFSVERVSCDLRVLG